MLIKNTTLSLTGIPLAAADKQTFKADTITLKPGANEIDTDLWTAVKKHTSVQRMLEDGRLVEVATELRDLSKLKQPEAIALVKETIDKSTLEAWLNVEKRTKVSDALAAQLEELEKLAKPPKGGSGADLDGPDDEPGYES